MYFFKAFGFVFKSEYQLPYTEIEPVTTPDVVIYDAPVPEKLENCNLHYGIWQGGPNALLLSPENIGRILVVNGNEVMVERSEGVDRASVGVFINGSAIAALLQQRGTLPLHASAIQTDQGAVLFAGPSGVGKSTAAASLNRRGHTVLADDVTAISLTDRNDPFTYPTYSKLRLWKDVTQKLGYNADGMKPTVNGLQKFDFPVVSYGHSPYSISRIYILSHHSAAEICISQLDKRQAFQQICSRSYRGNFHYGMGLQQQHFKLASTISARTTVRLIARPTKVCDPFQLADVVEQDLLTEDYPVPVSEAY